MQTNTMLGDYRLQEILAENKNFTLYRGLNVIDNVNYCIKVYNQENPQKKIIINNEVAAFKQYESQFTLKYLKYINNENQFFVIFENCEGFTLEHVWKEKKQQFSENEIIDLLIELIKGLKFIHQKNGVYLDLKMNNIIYNNGKIKFISFVMTTDIGETCQIQNFSFDSTSPEQIQSMQHYIESDCFQLGSLLYQILYRKQPFQAQDPQTYLSLIKKAQFQDDPTVKINQTLIELVQKMLNYKKEDRPSLEMISEELDKLKTSELVKQHSNIFPNYIQPIMETIHYTKSQLYIKINQYYYPFKIAEQLQNIKFYNFIKVMFPRFMLYKKSCCDLIFLNTQIESYYKKFRVQNEHLDIQQDLQTILDELTPKIEMIKQFVNLQLTECRNEKRIKYINDWESQLNLDFNNFNEEIYLQSLVYFIEYLKKSDIPYLTKIQNEEELKKILIIFYHLKSCPEQQQIQNLDEELLRVQNLPLEELKKKAQLK